MAPTLPKKYEHEGQWDNDWNISYLVTMPGAVVVGPNEHGKESGRRGWMAKDLHPPLNICDPRIE